jgi:hypothetical protein
MAKDEGKFEHRGTEPHGQAAEFVDTPENQPGEQDDPAPAGDDDAGRDGAGTSN